MSFRPPTLTITVSGGSGSATFNYGQTFNADCVSLQITPPVASPTATGTYTVTDDSGQIADSGNFSGTNIFKGQSVYSRIMTISLTSVSNDGIYIIGLAFSSYGARSAS